MVSEVNIYRESYIKDNDFMIVDDLEDTYQWVIRTFKNPPGYNK